MLSLWQRESFPMSHSGTDFGQMRQMPHSVLLIENDRFFCDALSDILRINGITVYVAHDGVTGASLYHTHQKQIDLVILDWRLPQQNGQNTLKKIRQHNPHVKVIVTSGISHHELHQELQGERQVTILHKPFGMNEFLNHLQEAMWEEGTSGT